MENTKEKLAELLNGREYGNEITKEEEQIAKESGLVVIFGASDDLVEFRGAIYDEISAYDGGSALLVKKKGGKIDVMSEDDFKELQEIMDDKELDFELPKVEVVAEWCPEDLECSWRIKSDVPHATFEIMEDGELYCIGIVVSIVDISNAL